MRHDSHFVESLSARFGASLGRWIPIDEIETNPDQPRTSVGDLTELTKSIESKGVLEPLLVRPDADGRFTDHRGRAPLPRRDRGGPDGGAVHRARRARERAARDRPHREPPAQGPPSLRGGRGLRVAPGAARVHAAADRGRRRQVARLDHRGAVAPRDSGGSPRRMSARRHRSALGAPRDRAPRTTQRRWRSDRARLRAARRATTCAREEEEKPDGRKRPSTSHSSTGRRADRSSSTSRSPKRASTNELIETLRGVLRQLEAGEIRISREEVMRPVVSPRRAMPRGRHVDRVGRTPASSRSCRRSGPARPAREMHRRGHMAHAGRQAAVSRLLSPIRYFRNIIYLIGHSAAFRHNRG